VIFLQKTIKALTLIWVESPPSRADRRDPSRGNLIRKASTLTRWELMLSWKLSSGSSESSSWKISMSLLISRLNQKTKATRNYSRPSGTISLLLWSRLLSNPANLMKKRSSYVLGLCSSIRKSKSPTLPSKTKKRLRSSMPACIASLRRSSSKAWRSTLSGPCSNITLRPWVKAK